MGWLGFIERVLLINCISGLASFKVARLSKNLVLTGIRSRSWMFLCFGSLEWEKEVDWVTWIGFGMDFGFWSGMSVWRLSEFMYL